MSSPRAVNDAVNVALAALMALASSRRPIAFSDVVATLVCVIAVCTIWEPAAISVGVTFAGLVDTFAHCGSKKS